MTQSGRPPLRIVATQNDLGPHSADRKNSAVIGTQKPQAWTGPATLCLVPHALAPVAELPVVEVVSAIHICADLTLGLGEVVHDYLRQPTRETLRIKEKIAFECGFAGLRSQ